MIKSTTKMICLALLLSVSACSKGTSTTSPSVGTNAPSATTGKGSTQVAAKADPQVLYKQNCMACHGTDLSGGIGPSLQKAGSRLSSDQIAAQIINGKGAMPPFKGTLKTPDIHALAEWLASNK